MTNAVLTPIAAVAADTGRREPAPVPSVQEPAAGAARREVRPLAHADMLEESGAPALLRLTLAAVGLVVLGFVLWAAVTRVKEVAVASGEVVPSGYVQTVQHLEGGLIADILVRDGDVVAAGALLIRLDATAAMAELERLRVRDAGLRLTAERLRAIASVTAPDFGVDAAHHPDLVAVQQTLYEAQVAAQDGERTVAAEQIAQRDAELAVISARRDALVVQSALLAEELEMRRQLYASRLSSKIAYLDVQRDVATIQGEIAGVLREQQRASRALAEARGHLAELELAAREAALTELGTVAIERAEVRKEIAALEDRVARLEIRAPVSGIVKGLDVNTIGGVVAPGQPLLEIVPTDSRLVVDARISTRDVGHVRLGQPVTVKVATYDFARLGGISAELVAVSASTFVDDDGTPYYRGRIVLDRAHVGGDPERNRVLPGMTIQADIETGEKTVLEYLLKPIHASIDEAFRER